MPLGPSQLASTNDWFVCIHHASMCWWAFSNNQLTKPHVFFHAHTPRAACSGHQIKIIRGNPRNWDHVSANLSALLLIIEFHKYVSTLKMIRWHWLRWRCMNISLSICTLGISRRPPPTQFLDGLPSFGDVVAPRALLACWDRNWLSLVKLVGLCMSMVIHSTQGLEKPGFPQVPTPLIGVSCEGKQCEEN